MKYISLGGDKRVVVDDSVFDFLSTVRWHVNNKSGKFYAIYRPYVGGKRKSVQMHRIVAMAPQDAEVDHINGDTLDNRFENLRLCTRAQNTVNSVGRVGKYGYRGVRKAAKKWRVIVAGQDVGYYYDIKEAANAYDNEVVRRYGDFAVTNKSLGLI